MNILLIYPRYPDTFWSFRYALRFTFKKATHPPLGLLTIASMLPNEWNKKLIDMNVTPLRKRDFKNIDLVFLSAMHVQKDSVLDVINLCKKFGVKIVAGGPMFTGSYEEFKNLIDYLVLNEAEITLPEFIKDFTNGKPKKIYKTDKFADITKTPIPLWNLLDMKKYTSMAIQYSRGCPFNCEFCEVTSLFGHRVRTKTKEQIVNELESLYHAGWRGSVFFVDDNFIASKRKVKREILPAIIEWQEKRNYPFHFYTQVSINLADDDELLTLMRRAKFTSVFVGIETPNEESLAEANKIQNINRNLVESIQKIQKSGLEVMGGFILGFDSDPPSIFDSLIKFIEETRIITAMVGLLNAPPKSKLYKRLKKEGRILPQFIGNNTDLSTNIIPKMDYQFLINGYKRVLRELYSSKNYYQRIKNYLKDFPIPDASKINWKFFKLHYGYLFAVFSSFWKFGIKDRDRFDFWKLIFSTLKMKPKALSHVLAWIITGYHFRKIFKEAFVN